MRTFSPRQAARALWQLRIKRRPYVLSHAVSSRCNLRCPFCEYWRSPGQEMDKEAVLRMLDDARSFGIGVYNAWTVEPLMRDDLPDILRHARSIGLMTSMVTNGKLLKSRVQDLSDLDYLSVSVDGIKSYRGLRGIDLDEVIDGIKAARDAGHEILINCVINGKNIPELEDIVRMAEDLGTWVSFEPVNESEGISGAVWKELGIRDTASYEKAVDRLIELKTGGAPIINSKTYLHMIRSLKPSFRCHASDIVLHVAADGTVENCRGYKSKLGHISDGLLNVWRSSAKKRKEAAENCQGCLFFGYVENSLLYDFVPEVMAHYEWM
ncbi:MAG TPA: radical SAM protein [Methanotrichaceae archaeon]|nr:radical SAM protein [Methanotrichaceae archaeon]